MEGISVSGYILDAPGRGLRKTVSPFCVAALVSAGTPFVASWIRFIIESIAYSSFESSPAIIRKASASVNSRCFLTLSTSESLNP